MKSKQLFTKMLLVALCLIGGSGFAWADGFKRTLHAQNYEAASDLSDWTAWEDGMKSLVTGDAIYGKYAQISIGSITANRGAYKTITPAFSFGSGYTTSALTTVGYNIEFDLKIRSGAKNDRSQSDFVVPTEAFTTTTGYYTGSTYVFSLSQPTRDADTFSTTWYINDVSNSTESTVTLTYNDWYHVKLVLTASSVDYTITNNTTSASVATGSKTVESLPSIWGLWTAVGRNAGFTYIDNIDIYDYSASESVTSPTISSTYNGANRTVTITDGTSSLSNTVKTYYTLDGSDPTSESTEYTTSINISENCTVKAISISSTNVASPISSLDVTVGKLTLATPTITASSFTNTTGKSVNNPTFSFACNNSAIDGNPTATLSYTFTPYGGVESSETPGSSYTPTAYGTLKVIASNDNYNPSEKTLVVSSLYTISYTGRDYTTATTSDISTTEGVWGDEFVVTWDGWASGLKANLRKTDMSDDYRLRIRNSSTINYVGGWGWVRHDNSYNYGSRYAKEGYFIGLKTNTSKGSDASALTYPTVYCVSGTGIATDVIEISVSAGNLVQQLYFYEATPTTVSKTISAAGWATYCSPYALDFSGVEGLTAYIVTGGADGKLTKSVVTSVPAGTGVLLKGAAGDYTIPVAASSATDVTGNKLTGVTTATQIAAEAGYVLMNGIEGVAFYKNANAFTVGANTAYLPADFDATTTPGARAFFSFGDDATDIRLIENGKIENSVYDLQGRRVSQPTKGLYIKDGKVVVVK